MAVLDYSLALLVAPIQWITTAEARTQINWPDDDVTHDGLLNRLIRAAVDKVEIDANRKLSTQTWIEKRDSFSSCSNGPRGEMVLSHGPLVSVTSITYLDGAESSQTLSASTVYEVDTARDLVRLRYGATYPTTLAHPDAITITYVVGEANPPEAARQAILLLVDHWFNNRGAVLIGTISKGLELSYNALIATFKRTRRGGQVA